MTRAHEVPVIKHRSIVAFLGHKQPCPERRPPSRSVRHLLLTVALVLVTTSLARASEVAADPVWVRPQRPGDPLIWGRRDGIVFGLPSPGGIRGPRGLIRIGVYTAGKTAPQLLNFIAIEPVIAGPGRRFDRLAFSELEPSVLDPGQPGKRLSVHADPPTATPSVAGNLQIIKAGVAVVERLSVRIDVERFTKNGAHVYLIASIESDHPYELRLSVFNEDDSPQLDELSVTATMGNYERLRLLWLRNRVEDSRTLFADYTGTAFDEKDNYPLFEMIRAGDGDAVVYCTSDEPSPSNTAGNSTAHWVYDLPKFSQYWRVPAHDLQPDLRVRVNARRVYYGSVAPLPGGVAFENFEVRERYVPGQTFIFGLSLQEPWVIDPRLAHLRSTLVHSEPQKVLQPSSN